MRKIVVAATLIAAGTIGWGSFAIAQNANGSHLPLGPSGTSQCEQAVAQVQSDIPDAVAQVQSDVDSVTSDPTIAAELKAAAAAAAPQLSADAVTAGHEFGC
jgi:hypothetical protein